MNTQRTSKKNYVEFFAQFRPSVLTANRVDGARYATVPRADKKILEELNFMNVAYLSDN